MLSPKKVISGLVLTVGTLSVLASPISPEEALKRLTGDSNRIGADSKKEITLVHTAYEGKSPALYVFSRGDGFMVLSADDEIPALLGWSDSPYVADNLPPAFMAWMDEICAETAALRDGVITVSEARAPEKDYEPIAPMCSTRWSQDAPYNDMCPKAPKTDTRCVTGCVATAMAQVMKYHNWPDKGEGRLMYSMDGKSMLMRLGDPYDWSNMLDDYVTGEYNDVESKAVAYLMKSCGYSVEMDYSISSSGAISPRVGAALGTNFKYDKSTLRYMMRDYFTLEEWEEMIYHSLATYGPVILDGQSNLGGHSFVCDGYDAGGYFHINWGWSGVSDGYFLLNALGPDSQGIGGSGDNSGFNYMQDAVLGITPAKDKDGAELENGEDLWIGQLYSAGPLGLDITREYIQGEVPEPICNDGVFNYGPAIIPESAGIGLIFRSENDEEIYGSLGKLGVDIELLTGFKDLELPLPSEVPDGKYLMTLSYCVLSEDGEDERWFDVFFPEGDKYYYAEVEGETIRFSPSEWRPSSIGEKGEMEKISTPRYFNLQGMEIKAPEAGEIVIVKEGQKVSKRRF